MDSLKAILTATALLCPLAFALPSYLQPNHYLQPRQNPPGVNGSLNFVQCRSEDAPSIQSLFKNSLEPDMYWVIAEAKKGVASPYFETFFKSNTNIPKVVEIFTRISKGDTYTLPDLQYSDHVQPGATRLNLTFTCKWPEGTQNQDYAFWEKYRGDDNKDSDFWTAEDVQNSPTIWLWPPFFDGQRTPQIPTEELCPTPGLTVDQLEYAKPNDDSLAHTQYGSIIRALANKYLYMAPVDSSVGNRTEAEKKMMGIQGCVGATAMDAVGNPQNYAMFASALKVGCDLSGLTGGAASEGTTETSETSKGYGSTGGGSNSTGGSDPP